MSGMRKWMLAIVVALFAAAAHANFHTWKIEAIYSNADGTVQFVVLHESMNVPGEDQWAGKAVTSTYAGVTKTFTFPANLPSNRTSGKRVLIATQGFAALGLMMPDYVVPNGFLGTDGGTLNY